MPQTPPTSGALSGTQPDLETAKQQLAQERAKLTVLEEGFDSLRDKLEADFKAKLPTLLSPEEKEAFDLDPDPVKLWDILAAKHKAMVIDPIEAKADELDKLEEQIVEAEAAIPGLEAVEKFAAEHPDIDLEELNTFFENELSLKQKEELRKDAGDDRVKYLQSVADLHAKANGTAAPDPDKGEGTGEKEPDLPADLHGIAGESGDPDGDPTEAKDEEFLAAIGMG